MPNVQHLEMTAGEVRTLALNARNPSNAPLNLSGKTVLWRVGHGPRNLDSVYPIVTKTGAVTGASSGAFSVSLAALDTQYLQGDYEHMALVDDVVVTRGRLRIKQRIAP